MKGENAIKQMAAHNVECGAYHIFANSCELFSNLGCRNGVRHACRKSHRIFNKVKVLFHRHPVLVYSGSLKNDRAAIRSVPHTNIRHCNRKLFKEIIHVSILFVRSQVINEWNEWMAIVWIESFIFRISGFHSHCLCALHLHDDVKYVHRMHIIQLYKFFG